jgi:hypothetical protein
MSHQQDVEKVVPQTLYTEYSEVIPEGILLSLLRVYIDLKGNLAVSQDISLLTTSEAKKAYGADYQL